MTVRVRLAPSPTGNLHIGTARTAVFNWLFARNKGGKFILRIEDTDQERSRPEFTQNIWEGLTWLGLNWDEGPFFQSERLDLYREAIRKLLDTGWAYRCYCTPEELDEMRSAQKAKNQAPRYDNRHRDLTPKQRADFEAQGREAVIRFKIDDNREIRWHDLVRGLVVWKGSDLGGDMVIARASSGSAIGQPLYNLAVVVDDIDMQITHVIRGEDHIANTAKQILLYEALQATVPEFAHTPLILNPDGRKLSKRDGVTSISDFRNLGYTAPALANYMALLGWTPADSTQEIFTLEQAAKNFDFDRVNKAGAKFDWDKLNWLNGQYIHNLPVSELTDMLIPYWQEAGYDFDPQSDRLWLEQLTTLIGPSLTRLKDAVDMAAMFFATSVSLDEEAQQQLQQEGAQTVLAAIKDKLESEPKLTADAVKDMIKAVAKETKLKKGLIMRSLRAALTGAVHGPDLVESWVLLHQRGTDLTRLQNILDRELLSRPNSMANHKSKPPQNPTPIEDKTSASKGATPAVDPTPAKPSTPEEKEPVVDSKPVAAKAPASKPEPEPVVDSKPVAAKAPASKPEPEPVVDSKPVAAKAPASKPEPEPQPVAAQAPEPEPKPEPKPEPQLEPEPQPVAAAKPAAMTSEPTVGGGVDMPEVDVTAIKEKVLDFFSNLPENFSKFFSEYYRPLTTVILIIVLFVTLRVLVGVIDIINQIPLVKPSLEMVGIGFSGWFVYRYLLRSETREELVNKLSEFKKDVFGEN